MDKKTTIGVFIAIVAVGVGSWLLFKKSPAVPQVDIPTNTASPAMIQQQAPSSTAKTIVVSLASQNNSGESGTATLTDIDGKTTKVAIALSGAPTGVLQPAHIHTGTCAAIGGVSFPLTFPTSGMSETTLNLSLTELLSKLPLAINVHKSASEASTYVACGDISNTSASSSQASPTVSQPAANTAPTVNNRSTGTFSTPTDNRRGADKPED